MIETATGIPVDGVIQTNIDFMKGSGFWDAKGVYQDGPAGVFERLLPEGLRIHISRTIHDAEYPEGYAKKTVDFKKNNPGEFTTLFGPQIVEYARSRHGDSDYGRNDGQREVFMAAGNQLGRKILKEAAKGNTATLDDLVGFLEEQRDTKNLFAVDNDIDVVEIVKAIRDSVQELRNTPLGLAKLALLAKNSYSILEKLWENPDVATFNWGVSELAGDARVPGDQYLTKIKNSSVGSPPTRFGNFLGYWDSVRSKIKEFGSWGML
jgi:hypothetical protein